MAGCKNPWIPNYKQTRFQEGPHSRFPILSGRHRTTLKWMVQPVEIEISIYRQSIRFACLLVSDLDGQIQILSLVPRYGHMSRVLSQTSCISDATGDWIHVLLKIERMYSSWTVQVGNRIKSDKVSNWLDWKPGTLILYVMVQMHAMHSEVYTSEESLLKRLRF